MHGHHEATVDGWANVPGTELWNMTHGRDYQMSWPSPVDQEHHHVYQDYEGYWPMVGPGPYYVPGPRYAPRRHRVPNTGVWGLIAILFVLFVLFNVLLQTHARHGPVDHPGQPHPIHGIYRTDRFDMPGAPGGLRENGTYKTSGHSTRTGAPLVVLRGPVLVIGPL
jgi:hypothetical protein